MNKLLSMLTFARVAEFSARNPDVVIDVAFEDRRVDLIERGLEFAVQVGELRDSGNITRMLNRGPRLTAASPAYFARHGEPQSPGDLAAHNCIVRVMVDFLVEITRVPASAERAPTTRRGVRAARK